MMLSYIQHYIVLLRTKVQVRVVTHAAHKRQLLAGALLPVVRAEFMTPLLPHQLSYWALNTSLTNSYGEAAAAVRSTGHNGATTIYSFV